ncbi:peptidase S8 [Paraclostridium bifermentans]|uniref:bile acid germinant receptor pseudoprotease CspC n=1 Tax=Paraclostridium bifermentans TaxID=1490 RepID=UPI0021C41476|nr:bile acid germinant receptor pseudoprotease CspC [Paraclostridium bifermentans]GKZ03785.1 peptidase S8 [Paraclostridium bifermentans]GKZ05281.1 peptidase S8 [Paraclostridium bifermentans]GKZ11038.1 peptidase S8 [Paraclostridium bifermentans]
MDEKSYYLLYSGDIKKSFEENNIDKYIILNDQLASIYVNDDFEPETLDNIKNVEWWSPSDVMSSLINITNNLEGGESVKSSIGGDYIESNPYLNVTGKDILVAVIDSGVDYLHEDLIDENNNSKILYLWDQENNSKSPPEGMIFGSEYTREEINEAIKNKDSSLSVDTIGTGTIACGIIAGQGNINREYRGIARDADLLVVKLRQFKDVYYDDKISYAVTDFLAALTYVLKISVKENKALIINFTLGNMSSINIEAFILQTYGMFDKSGIVLVSGAGNEGNTDVHYQGHITSEDNYIDVIIQNGNNKNLEITIRGRGPDKLFLQIISPSGDISQIIRYAPDDRIYRGRFYIEKTSYTVLNTFPWIKSGDQMIRINLNDIKPGIWTLRISPEFIIHGDFNVYLPNKSIIAPGTRFVDSTSKATITFMGLASPVITIGAYSDKTNSLWIGSSKGNLNGNKVRPDIIAPGVDVISTYVNNSYNTATGTGVSSSIVCGSLALIMEYLKEESRVSKLSLFTEPLRTYLMIGATRQDIYEYPNIFQGYGIFDLRNTFRQIAKNL